MLCQTDKNAQKLKICSFLQCGSEYMRQGDELIHVLTHHIRLTEDQLRENLRCYIMNRLDWVEKISACVLKQRDQSLEDYIDEITTPGVPLDPIALLVKATNIGFMSKAHCKECLPTKGTVFQVL